jgi:ribosomal protein S18 acetylase RimI-like enzyme
MLSIKAPHAPGGARRRIKIWNIGIQAAIGFRSVSNCRRQYRTISPFVQFSDHYNNSMIESPIGIRNFQPPDLDTLFRIDQICFPAYIAFSRAEFVSYLNHPKRIARVAETSGRIIGFILARIRGSSHAHILTLDVVPDARRCRVGTQLMNDLHKELERLKIGACVLEVGVRNIAAQRLYEKLHYRNIGILPGYYHEREDACRMIRITKGSADF